MTAHNRVEQGLVSTPLTYDVDEGAVRDSRGENHDRLGTLYMVATPLGNLGDFSLRGQQVLAECDYVYAEDTRRSQHLLSHFGIRQRLYSLHQHNERQRVEQVASYLNKGASVALLTDAGTPVVSDPGAKLAAEMAALGFIILPIPGPSALTAALSVAGFTEGADDVLFLGFLPVKGAARAAKLEQIGAHQGQVVVFEAPHRIAATLHDLQRHGGDRYYSLCRELTKKHEEVIRGTVSQVLSRAEAGLKGEITLVLGPQNNHTTVSHGEQEIDRALKRCFDIGFSLRDATAAVAAVYQLKKRAVYQRGLALLDDSKQPQP